MILVVLSVFFSIITPGHKFLSTPVINILLEVSPTVLIVTVAMALLLISGEFDLSVGSIYVLTASVVAILYTNYGVNPAIAILAGLALGGFCGFINGVTVTQLGISSLIVTLGTMWAFRGIAYVITNGSEIPYYPERTSPIFLNFFCGKIWTIPAKFLEPTIPAQFLWLIAVTIFLWVLLEHTKIGNWIFATGSNKESARMMGINTNGTKIICFIIMGVLSAFAGIIQATRIRIADPSAVQTLNLEAIAGAVVGGTSLSGGVGSILGAVLGALCIRVLSIGLTMMGLSPYYFQIATGALLVIAVAANVKIKQKMLRRS
jgi:ribose/xylose/arabinose/galactoside ABC-type transport system permease subunit